MDRHWAEQGNLTEPIACALGAETVDGLARETGMQREDVLSQLARLLPEVVDKLTPGGKLPNDSDLVEYTPRTENARKDLSSVSDGVNRPTFVCSRERYMSRVPPGDSTGRQDRTTSGRFPL